MPSVDSLALTEFSTVAGVPGVDSLVLTEFSETLSGENDVCRDSNGSNKGAQFR